MGGFAYGFADGGDVEDDNSGALPVAADDGAPAAQQDDQQQEERPWYSQDNGMMPVNAAKAVGNRLAEGQRSDMVAPHEALRNAGRGVLSYLMGAGAADPTVAKKFDAGVKAEYPGVSDDDANVLAVHKAYELGGPEAAWQMVQFNRTAYNAKQSFAFTAMRGTPQKPADPQAAAQAATQASQHVLDGSQSMFTATPDGFITATVKMPDSDRTMSFNLSPEQFAQYLNVGKDGQWDHVMEKGGVPGTLQRLANTGADATTTSAKGDGGATRAKSVADSYEDDDTDTGDMSPIVRKGTKDGSNFGKTPSTLDLSNGETETFTPQDTLEARANKLFPSASQGAQRSAYIAQQRDQAAKGRRDLRAAEVRGDAMRDVAGVRAAGQIGASENRKEGTIYSADKKAEVGRESNQQKQEALAAKIKMEADRTTDLNKRAQLRADYSLVNSPNFAMMSDQQKAAILTRAGLPVEEQKSWFGFGGGAKPPAQATPPAAQQQTPSAQGQGQGQGGGSQPGPGKKFFNGQWYTREEYQRAFGK